MDGTCIKQHKRYNNEKVLMLRKRNMIGGEGFFLYQSLLQLSLAKNKKIEFFPWQKLAYKWFFPWQKLWEFIISVAILTKF